MMITHLVQSITETPVVIHVFVDFSSAFNTAQLHILMQWMLCSSCHTMKEVFNYFS